MKNFLGKFSISLILLLCLSTSYVYAFNEESKADNNPKENKIIYLTLMMDLV